MTTIHSFLAIASRSALVCGKHSNYGAYGGRLIARFLSRPSGVSSAATCEKTALSARNWLMGTHGARIRPRALPPARQADKSTNVNSGRQGRRMVTLADWPVARRLFTVIVVALLMGLVFGGLRVAAAEASASQFSRTQQLASLGVQLTNVVDDLQNERDATLVA